MGSFREESVFLLVLFLGSFVFLQFKSNLALYSLYYDEACNGFAGPISKSLQSGKTTSFEEMLRRWRTVGNTVFDMTGQTFEPQTSRSRDKSVTT